MGPGRYILATMRETLFEETMRLLADTLQRPGESVAGICRATGLKQRWMGRLIQGDYEDPGVNKIEKLNIHLRREARKHRRLAS